MHGIEHHVELLDVICILTCVKESFAPMFFLPAVLFRAARMQQPAACLLAGTDALLLCCAAARSTVS